MQEKIRVLAKLINSQMPKYDKIEITKALKILLSDSNLLEIIEQYDMTSADISSQKFQGMLSVLNEKSTARKDKGVYYTSNDVSKYIIINSLLNRYNEQNRVFSFDEGIKRISELSKEQLDDLVFKTKIIDPTCGGGEFLISIFDIKYELFNGEEDEDLLKITKTIFGNDIDDFSILICKVRFFFYVCDRLKNKMSYAKLAKIIDGQFYCVDFVSNHKSINLKFDIAVGNPPYVEYGKYPEPSLLNNNFGNIYADVLKNSFDILPENGIAGYIIPISYSSTPRMKDIRDFVESQSTLQFILSFADRPDCLFNGVHQKLNIVIAKKGTEKGKRFTSSYQYWYKSERKSLFDNISVIQNKYEQSDFIPKLGNRIEQDIYKKVLSNSRNNINSFIKESEHQLYLNTRACFWIKAFMFNPGSKEYKKLCFSEEYKNYIMCVLNSSLFWFFWVVVSDCWHITTKDLINFWIPNVFDPEKFNQLAKELEEKLEKTKKYIGSKQTEYEYKHKMCKDVIDKIDEEIAKGYNLTPVELDYIKNFALKYRKGDGSIEKSN